MKKQIKQELHQLIDTCDSDQILEQTKELLQSVPTDWWEELTEEDRNLVMESESSYKRGDFISHEELMHQLDAKKKSSSGQP